MEVPKQTSEIFEILSKGQFISANSESDMRRLYEIIDSENNFELLYDYFQKINFTLESGNGYYYFSRNESKASLERKIEQAYKWIDILDFFKTYDNSFASGYRFQPAEILIKLTTDADLKSKLENLKKYSNKKVNFADILADIIKILKNESFIEEENSINQTYKVLAAFNYIENLVLAINIHEDIENEIPE